MDPAHKAREVGKTTVICVQKLDAFTVGNHPKSPRLLFFCDIMLTKIHSENTMIAEFKFKKFKLPGIKAIALILFLLSINFSCFAGVEDYFTHIKADPNALYAFLKKMPKGGELHYHLAGGAYPENMLGLAATGDYCIKSKTYVVSKTSPCTEIKPSIATEDPDLYNQIIRAWSMKDFIPGQETGHDHFFATFFKFIPLVFDFRPQLLAEIMQRASDQQELYLEILLSPDNGHATTFAPLIKDLPTFDDKKRALLAHPDFQKNIEHTVAQSHEMIKKAKEILQCHTLSKQPGCEITVKFQYDVLREQPLNQVFAQALNAFASASKSTDLIAVNLVQAEDGPVSLRDYHQQMLIFNYLHKAYPAVHISLHAGELAPQDVKPADLRFHIHDAIFTGQAERIGHGVDIAYENNAEALLQHMAKKPIPVEINLTSNRAILTIFGKRHPLNYYLNHQVPVILSTDDEGILRTDLTREYARAVSEHGLDYTALKAISRHSLTYSFLPGASLWSEGNDHKLILACKNLDSLDCKQFTKQSLKAQLQWQLEKNFLAFEETFS
jgi:adenosine deaminase